MHHVEPERDPWAPGATGENETWSPSPNVVLGQRRAETETVACE